MDVGGTNNTSFAIYENYLIAQLSILLIKAYCIPFKQYIPLYTGGMDCDCIIASMYECDKMYNFSKSFAIIRIICGT